MQATATSTQATDSVLAYRLGVVVGYLMQTCGRDVVQIAAENDMSFTQMKALHALREATEPISVKELGDRLGLSLAAISRSADGLVQRGLVARQEDPEDRRIKRLTVTAAGDELIGTVVRARLAGLEDFVTTLSDKERALLDKALAPILARSDVAAFEQRNSE